MQFFVIKATITAIWVSAVCAAGIAGNFSSVTAWIALTGLAVVPPLIMLWRLHVRPPTMSERIQEALR